MRQLLPRRERRQLAREQKRQQSRCAPGTPPAASFLHWAIPCLAAFLAYIRTVSFDFIRNDYAEVSLIRGLWHEITRPTHCFGMYYRPVYSAWMFAVRSFAGENPAIWHFASVVLHVAATYAVFRFVQAFVKNLAASSTAAVVFAIHPVHIEAVSWILSNNEMLYTIFFLGSILLLAASERLKRPAYLLASVLGWAAAVLSKETAVALLPIFPVVVMIEDSSFKRALRIAVPYAGVTIGYLFARAAVLHSPLLSAGITRAPRPWRTVLCSLPGISISYFRKLLWPSGLTWVYEVHLLNGPAAGMWFALLMLLVAAAVLAWIVQRNSLAGLATALIVLPLLPVLYGIRFFPGDELIGDRYLYLPTVGLSLFIGLLVKRSAAWSYKNKRALRLIGCLAAVSFVWLLFAQQGIYADSEHLHLRVLELNPKSTDAMRNLALLYSLHGDMDRSLAMDQRILELTPNDRAAAIGAQYARSIEGTPLAAGLQGEKATQVWQHNAVERERRFEQAWDRRYARSSAALASGEAQ